MSTTAAVLTYSDVRMAASWRWDALDVLRGLTIILMLMNLSHGAARFAFGGILVIFAMLLVCHRRRWILKL